jgi:acetylornithine deacetylase
MQIPPLKEMVSSLIAAPSVSSTMPQFDQSNLDVVHLLANWLTPLGFNVDIQPIVDHPGKANIIATLGEGRDGLLLSGHTDTVPFDAHLWQSDPFTVQERDNRWYGLGICDMKSFLAMCVTAAANYAQTKPKRPLTILGTADEESSMSGARSITRETINHSRFALIGEPTNLQAITRHKGIMMLSLTITGHSGHSSNPELGNNAIDGTGIAIELLSKFRTDMAKKYQDTQFEVHYPTLNLGCIHGGDNPNRICDHAELSFDLRILPGMNSLAIVEQLDNTLGPVLNQRGLAMDLKLLHAPINPFECNGIELLDTITQFQRSRDDTSSNTHGGAVAFATEAPFLTDLGVETIVMGPGSINQAHQPNEFLDLSQLDPTIAIIRALIQKYCY